MGDRCTACGQDLRCTEERNGLRCQGLAGHYPETPHHADVGKPPGVWRWGMAGFGCHEPRCNRSPGHPLPHNDGRGTSWRPMEDGEAAADA